MSDRVLVRMQKPNAVVLEYYLARVPCVGEYVHLPNEIPLKVTRVFLYPIESHTTSAVAHVNVE